MIVFLNKNHQFYLKAYVYKARIKAKNLNVQFDNSIIK